MLVSPPSAPTDSVSTHLPQRTSTFVNTCGNSLGREADGGTVRTDHIVVPVNPDLARLERALGTVEHNTIHFYVAAYVRHNKSSSLRQNPSISTSASTSSFSPHLQPGSIARDDPEGLRPSSVARDCQHLPFSSAAAAPSSTLHLRPGHHVWKQTRSVRSINSDNNARRTCAHSRSS